MQMWLCSKNLSPVVGTIFAAFKRKISHNRPKTLFTGECKLTPYYCHDGYYYLFGV